MKGSIDEFKISHVLTRRNTWKKVFFPQKQNFHVKYLDNFIAREIKIFFFRQKLFFSVNSSSAELLSGKVLHSSTQNK